MTADADAAARRLIDAHLAATADEPLAELPADWPVAVWQVLIRDYPDCRYWAAHSCHVPDEILRLLARAEEWRVRGRVGQKRRTPPDVLAQLAADPSEIVRQRVAANAKAPQELIERLAGDPVETVARVARYHLERRLEKERQGPPTAD